MCCRLGCRRRFVSGVYLCLATDSPVSPVHQIPGSQRYVPSSTVCPWSKKTVMKTTFSSGNSLLVLISLTHEKTQRWLWLAVIDVALCSDPGNPCFRICFKLTPQPTAGLSNPSQELLSDEGDTPSSGQLVPWLTGRGTEFCLLALFGTSLQGQPSVLRIHWGICCDEIKSKFSSPVWLSSLSCRCGSPIFLPLIDP